MQHPCDISRTEHHEPTAVLEALLFLSGQPLSLPELCIHTGWSEEKAEQTAHTLAAILRDEKRGLTLIQVAGGYQLVTRPELHDELQWVHKTTAELSPMALEVLAIIAFRQPVTRADIEKIRGVSSERLIASLLQQGLIRDLGRKDTPGRPIIYGTSAYFLECIGMDSLSDLARQVPEELLQEPAADAETVKQEEKISTEEEHEGTLTKGNE